MAPTAPSTPPPAAQPTAWQMSPPPAGAAQGENPMAVHLKVVAILEIVWGALAALGAVIVLLIFSVANAATRAGGAPAFVPHLLASLGILIAVVLGGLAALAIVGGSKLLHRKRSGKTITFVVAILSLLSFPIGTAYGVYALIILTRDDTDRLLVD